MIQPATAAAPETSPAPSTVPSRQTPVPVQTPPTRGASPQTLSPAVSRQGELAQRYNAALTRATRAKYALARLTRTQAAQGTQLPADVRDARDRLDTQIRAVIGAIQRRDTDLEQKLQSVEDTVTVIEKYLGK